LIPLLRSLVRPYRSTLFLVMFAMLVQTLMSLAAPWPLKIVLDNVVGSHKLPSWLDDVLKPVLAGSSKMEIAVAAAIMVVVIALVGALASYIANYYTESV
jgi:ABC-type multidrug transport system fused ATPase/permease subunit